MTRTELSAAVISIHAEALVRDVVALRQEVEDCRELLRRIHQFKPTKDTTRKGALDFVKTIKVEAAFILDGGRST